MKLYRVEESYISKLRTVDNRVMYNKDTRPYLGVVLEVNGYNYFVPLSSPKENKKINNQLCIKVFENNNQANLLGYLLFLNMIPVPDKYLTELDMEIIKQTDESYYSLIINQLIFIRTNQNRIHKKAEKVYNNTIIKEVPFFTQMCLRFTELENECK